MDSPGRAEAAAELDELGFASIWIPADVGDVFANTEALLAATKRITVATGILSIYDHPVERVVEHVLALEAAYPGRFLLGLGVSHRWVVDRGAPGRYGPPLRAMAEFLDALDAVGRDAVGPRRRIVAALGPKMTRTAAARSLGAHPFLVGEDWLARQREEIGPEPLLAPILPVTLESGRAASLQLGRDFLPFFLAMSNYRESLLRGGFDAAEIDGVSDRLSESLIVCGDESVLPARLDALDAIAGPNLHPILRHLPSADDLPLPAWRRWAAALS